MGAGYSETLQISGCADPLEGRSQNACTSLPAIVTEDAFKRLNLDAIGVDAIVWAAAGKHGMNMPPNGSPVLATWIIACCWSMRRIGLDCRAVGRSTAKGVQAS